MMATHMEKAQALAEKITAKASATLDVLDREMILMKWPAEYRAIMWDAVTETAMRYAQEQRALSSRADETP